jgi:hypothetical protein
VDCSRPSTRAVGYDHYGAANGQYGPLALLVGDQLGFIPTGKRLGTLVTFEHRKGEWHWLLRPEVARPLELLDWM